MDGERDFYILKWFYNYKINPEYDGDDLSKRYIPSVTIGNPGGHLIAKFSLCFYGIVDDETGELLNITHGPYKLFDSARYDYIIHLNDIIPSTDVTPECKVVFRFGPFSKTSDFMLAPRHSHLWDSVHPESR